MNYDTKEVKEQIATDWYISTDMLKDCKILYSNYTYEGYSGFGFVIFRRDGKLYEVNGSHCSCYGLEGQWDEEETSKEALLHRLTEGHMYGVEKDELLAIVKKLRK